MSIATVTNVSGVGEYGVGIGRFVKITRDKADDFGRFYHGHITITFGEGAAPSAAQFEAAVDVNKPGGSIEYSYVDNLDPAPLHVGLTPDPGYHQLDKMSMSGALDYRRAPLLNLGGSVPGGTGAVASVDVAEHENQMSWRQNVGTAALEKLESLFVGREPQIQTVRLYGAAFTHQPGTPPAGVHDVHCNQGDPPGPFQHLDGIWQDGGVIVEYVDGHLEGFFVKFTSQTLDTDEAGHPLPGGALA